MIFARNSYDIPLPVMFLRNLLSSASWRLFKFVISLIDMADILWIIINNPDTVPIYAKAFKLRYQIYFSCSECKIC